MALRFLPDMPRLTTPSWRADQVVVLVGGVLLGTMASVALAEAALRATGVAAGPHATFWRMVAGLAGLQGPGLALIHVFLRRHGHDWASGLGLRPDRRAVAWGVVVALGSVLVAYPVEHGIMEGLKALGRSPEPQASVQFLRKAPPWQQAVLGVLAVLPAALVEEALFRGILFAAGRAAGHRLVALVGSSLLFGLAHGHGPTLLPLTLLGIALAWTYERTGNLLACCVAHAGFNAVGLAVAISGLGMP